MPDIVDITIDGQPIRGYCNHPGGVSDGAGNLFYALTVGGAALIEGKWQSTSNILVIKREQGTGKYTKIAYYAHEVYGKFGYADVQVVGPHLVILPSINGDGWQGIHKEFKEYNKAVPLVSRSEVESLRARVAQLEQQLKEGV